VYSGKSGIFGVLEDYGYFNSFAKADQFRKFLKETKRDDFAQVSQINLDIPFRFRDEWEKYLNV
jgi:hypothetical protein